MVLVGQGNGTAHVYICTGIASRALCYFGVHLRMVSLFLECDRRVDVDAILFCFV